MNIFSFIYLVAIYLVFVVFNYLQPISIQNQLVFSTVLILAFGVPHGSIDNLLYLTKHKISSFTFYFFYLSIMMAYAVSWFFFPISCFVLFLLLSAYHFGESHFSDYAFPFKWRKGFYFLWGIFLLASLLFWNKAELLSLSNSFSDTASFNQVYSSTLLPIVFYASAAVTLVSLLYLLLRNTISLADFFSELFQIFILQITFYLFPILIGFTLYFVCIHSLRSLYQEYHYLKAQEGSLSILKFIRYLLPHTLISFFFIGILMYVSLKEYIAISSPMISIIMISVITLPHSIVMSNFLSQKSEQPQKTLS